MEDVLISDVSPEVATSKEPNAIEEIITNGIGGKDLEEPVLVNSELTVKEQPEVQEPQHLHIESNSLFKEQDTDHHHEQEQR